VGKSAEGKVAAQGLERLRQELSRSITQAHRLLAELGASPRALAAIAKDTGIGRAARATAALRELDAHLEENYPRELEA
jgi:hypothetical protein